MSKYQNRSVMQPSITHATHTCAKCVVMLYSSEFVLSLSGASLLTVYHEGLDVINIIKIIVIIVIQDQILCSQFYCSLFLI